MISKKNNILEGINKCIRSWSNKKGQHEALLISWKNKISACIKEIKAKMQFSKICIRKNYTYMQNKAVKVVLLDLHDRYVITPTDKTNNNVALNCTRFYALTSFRELGITNLKSTKTHEHCKNVNHDTFCKKSILMIFLDIF